MESNRIEIHVPPCSSSYPIFKDIYAFLHKQGNHIPIHLQKSELFNTIEGGGGGGRAEQEVRGTFFQTFSRYMDNVLTPFSSKNTDTKTTDISSPTLSNTLETTKSNTNTNTIVLLFDTNHSYTMDHIKGTKLYYLFLRNGECARWI
jgi:hypothetical protein